MDEATRICARLLREGNAPRAELPSFDVPEVRRKVERRLRSVGLMLLTSSSSDYVGLRLAPDIVAAVPDAADLSDTSDAGFDAASHLGLRPEACALLVILWARLLLHRRTPPEAAEPPRVHLEALVRDFRSVLGGRSRIQRLVQQLRRLRFLAGQGEEIEAGPLLDLAIDGDRMMGFLRRETLAGLLEEQKREIASPGPPASGGHPPLGLGAQVLEAIARLGGTAAMGDLSRLTNAPASRLRRILRELETAGWVRRTGERASARYHLARRPEGES